VCMAVAFAGSLFLIVPSLDTRGLPCHDCSDRGRNLRRCVCFPAGAADGWEVWLRRSLCSFFR
jgi:hypothetical protein